jgi:hypothetical protein
MHNIAQYSSTSPKGSAVFVHAANHSAPRWLTSHPGHVVDRCVSCEESIDAVARPRFQNLHPPHHQGAPPCPG